MEPIDAARRRSHRIELRECLLIAAALYGLAPGNVCAGDAAAQKSMRAQIAAPSFPAPFAFSAARAESQEFSPTEFRPRRPGLPEIAAARSEASVIDAPILRDSSIARELSAARTQDRVRLLTLWQNRASSLSLQAGKRGAPSLQWSTPWMHRDAASRGLFDRLLLVSPRSVGSGTRGGGSHPVGAIAPAKPSELGTPVNSK